MSRDNFKPGKYYLILDLIAAEAAFFSAVMIRFGGLYPIPPFFDLRSYLFYGLLVPLIYLLVLISFSVQTERQPQVQSLFKSVFVVTVVATLLQFYFRGFAFSRVVTFSFCALTLAYGLFWRFVFQIWLDSGVSNGIFRERVMLVALGGRLEKIVEAVSAGRSCNLEVIGLAAEGEVENESALKASLSLSSIESIDKVPEIADSSGVDVVLLDPEGIRPERWIELAGNLQRRNISLRIISTSEPDLPFPVTPSGLGPLSQADLSAAPVKGVSRIVKRTLDVLISLFILIVSLPLLLLVALIVEIKSPGKVFYVQERIGKDGVPFRLYKFRTMAPDAEKASGPVWSGENDSRVIAGIGGFLRRTGIDELPQLWNVLRGEMSIVGPRPERAFFFDSYPQLYRGRLAVKPGITGLAQINGRDFDVEKKVRYDLFYIRNFSLALDMDIIWRTTAMLVVQEWRILFSKDQEEADKGKE